MHGYFDDGPNLSNYPQVPNYRTVKGRYHYGDRLTPHVLMPPVHEKVLFQHRDLGLLPEYLDPTSREGDFLGNHPLRYGVAELEGLAEKSEALTVQDPEFDSMSTQYYGTGYWGIKVTYFDFNPSAINRVLSAIRAELGRRLYTVRLNPDASSNENFGGDLVTRGLHPVVVKASEQSFEDGYYRQAILDAYISLEQAVQEKSSCHDRDGKKLMDAVFSPKNPILKVSEDANEQQGCMFLFNGAVMGVRNPRAHKTLSDTPQIALEWLSFFSALFRILDESSLRADNEA